MYQKLPLSTCHHSFPKDIFRWTCGNEKNGINVSLKVIKLPYTKVNTELIIELKLQNF